MSAAASSGPAAAAPPPIRRVVETALYCDDLERATAFYRDVLGLRVLDAGARLVSIDAGGATLLLLFRRGATTTGFEFPGGRIPPHDGAGPAHLAFAVDADDLDAWERALVARGIEVESRTQWTRGGRSLYFRDPDGHSVELVTPGTWPTY
jgi:catechol 2,3-dioxygenase-like lactoylglutathione lyase family enzyme